MGVSLLMLTPCNPTGEVFSVRAIKDDAAIGHSADGFWGDHNRVYCDVRIFNPLPSSQSMSAC